MKILNALFLTFYTSPFLILAQSPNRVTATYNLMESHRASLPEGMMWGDIPFVLEERLAPTSSEQIIMEVITNDFDKLTTIQYVYRDDEEEWMNLPYRVEVNCQEVKTYDKNNQLLVTYLAEDNSATFCEQFREDTRDLGYSPGYLIFPVPDINARDMFLQQGLLLDSLSGGVVMLTDPELNFTEIYDPNSYTIHQIQIGDSIDIETTEVFEPSDLWGCLPSKKTVRSFLKNGIVITDEEVYTNFEIEGYIEPLIPEARPQNTEITASISPNPVTSITLLSLTNQSEQIQAIKVYDFYNQLLLQIDGNGFSEQQLNLSSLAPQLYLLKIETLNAEHHLTFQKL